MKKLEHKVPNLRFKGFTDYWEQHKLGEIITYYNGKSHEEQFRNAETQNFELVTLKSIDGNGNLCSSEKYIDSTNNTLSKNDLIMVLSEQNTGLVGMTTLIPRDNYYVLNQRVALLKLHKNNSPFFLTDAINQHQIFFERMSAGTKVQNISKSNVENFNLYIPNYSEQKEVGHIIALCQNIITLQQRKLDLLKQFKKGLLQKMFADKDSKQPVLRFNGFHYDWEQHKLKTVVSVNSGKDYKSLEKGNIPVYGTGGYITSVSKSLSNQDAIGLGRKGTINKPYILKAPFWTVDTLFYLTLKPENILTFIYSLIQKINWLKYDESTGLPSLSKKNIENVLVYLTKLDEQQKIGKLIVKLDKLITLQQQKLAKYQSIKKSLLQQMFI